MNGNIRLNFCAWFVFVWLFSLQVQAATKTTAGSGNWSAAATWSPSGAPAAGDNVIIKSGDVVTVDGNYTCNGLNIGSNAASSDATVQIMVAGNSLTINGDLQINPSSKTRTYILDAGPGTVNIAGTFSVWNTAGSLPSYLRVGSGTLNITPAITISNIYQSITFTGAGTVNLNAGFTDQYNRLVTYTGCTVNFKSSYTVNTSASDWAGKGTAVFWSGASITPTSALTLNNFQTNISASVTLNTGAGTVAIAGSVTLASGSTFTTNKDIEVRGDWNNNGGTFSGTNDTLTLNSASGVIGGTSSTSFRTLRIGRSAGSTAVSYTANSNITCNYLRISTGSADRTLTIISGKTITVNNDVVINQPIASGTTSSLTVGAGSCNISGNLIFSGTSSTDSQIGQIAITSGSLTINGSVTWMSNLSSATELISLGNGTLTFGTSLSMASASGTLSVTGAGTVNFNGASAPSLSFGGIIAPVFTTTSGCSINFIKGFTNSVTPLVFASGTYSVVGTSGSASNFSIDPTSIFINNGTLRINGDLTAVAPAKFENGINSTLEISGNVAATVTIDATAAGNMVKYNGSGTQSIKSASYYNLVTDNSGAKTFGSGITIINNLTVQGASTFNNTQAQAIGGTYTYASTGTSTLANSISAKGFVLSSGILNDGGQTISINDANGWTHNGGTFNATGSVAFNGSTASQIGGTMSTTFKNLTINNPAGVILNVNPAAATSVTGSLTLSSGILQTSASNILRLVDNAVSGIGSANSYVEGPMIKVGNDDFVFPIGKSGRWRRIGVSGIISTTTEITAEYFPTPYNYLTPLSSNLTEISQSEYWDVNRTVSADPVKLKLFWEDAAASGIVNCEYLTIAHYKNGQWEEESAGLVPGSSCYGSGSIETNGFVSSFSPFGFGGHGGTALPVKLSSFDARAKGSSVLAKWTTELEINNDYFTLERSSDGKNFNAVSRVPGNGNSTVMHSYEAIDIEPLEGVSYYRLRQIDFDREFTYSEIVAVNFNEHFSFRLFPNPAESELFVTTTKVSSDTQLTIYDMAGKEVYTKMILAKGDDPLQSFAIPIKGVLPPGIYLVTASTEGSRFKEKLTVR